MAVSIVGTPWEAPSGYDARCAFGATTSVPVFQAGALAAIADLFPSAAERGEAVGDRP